MRSLGRGRLSDDSHRQGRVSTTTEGRSASPCDDRSVATGSGVAEDSVDSIRINAQWRICFRWTEDGPCDVEIVDYH